SYVVSPMVVTHFDIGGTVTPSARDVAGDKARTMGWVTAGSAILTASNRIQPMLEAIYSSGEEVIGRDHTARSESFLISPGIRAAFNFASGLQIVPGIAFPIGVGPSSGERSAFLYLSFEHPFTRDR
ncbi:MAG: transporter, partial [Chthoniobacterales bacterium]